MPFILRSPFFELQIKNFSFLRQLNFKPMQNTSKFLKKLPKCVAISH
jgi:hypothetical protein